MSTIPTAASCSITNRFCESGFYRVTVAVAGFVTSSVEIRSIQSAFDLIPEGCSCDVFITPNPSTVVSDLLRFSGNPATSTNETAKAEIAA